MRSAARRVANRRIAAMRAVLVLAFVVLAARAGHLAVASERGEGWRDGQVHTALRLAPARGRILDRDGVELALSVRSPSVWARPGEMRDRKAAASALAPILGLDTRTLSRRLAARDQYTFLARWISDRAAARVSALDLDGVGLVYEPRRAYPAGPLAAQVLGFVDIDGRGVRGIERQEDDWLRGEGRRVAVERDGSGRLMAPLGVDVLDAAGGDVVLTLDARMQAEAQGALDRAVESSAARGGQVIALDPHTGEILALAEAPTFDPNRFRELDFDATGSGAFLHAVEPGSTLKLFVVAAALDAGAIEPDTEIDCSEGFLRVRGGTIRDHEDYGVLDPTGVLRVSSNVGAVRIAQALGAPAHHAALRRFGFGTATGSGFPAESAGLLRAPQGWQPLDHANIAFGQGIGVTTVQLAAATATLANGGEWVRPRLVSGRRHPDGRWLPTTAEVVRRAISRETSAAMLGMMESVVQDGGTGRRAGLAGMRVAGKTGTAQKLDPETGRYSRERYIAWFVGVVPADAPRLVIVVALDEPSGRLHSGGAVAAPLFADVAATHLAHMGWTTEPQPVPAAPRVAANEDAEGSAGNPGEGPTVERRERPDPGAPTPAVAAGPPGREAPNAQPSDRLTRLGDRLLLPDLRGLSVAEVDRIAFENALDLQRQGAGLVVEQQPLPGTILPAAEARVWVRFAQARGGR